MRVQRGPCIIIGQSSEDRSLSVCGVRLPSHVWGELWRLVISFSLYPMRDTVIMSFVSPIGCPHLAVGLDASTSFLCCFFICAFVVLWPPCVFVSTLLCISISILSILILLLLSVLIAVLFTYPQIWETVHLQVSEYYRGKHKTLIVYMLLSCLLSLLTSECHYILSGMGHSPASLGGRNRDNTSCLNRCSRSHIAKW